MTTDSIPGESRPPRPRWVRVMTRADVMSGLLFIIVAGIGLAVSWNYPIGTAVRMGTGYVPRLMLWILLALGIVVLTLGLRGRDDDESAPPLDWRPLVLVPLALTVFALAMSNDMGFVVAGLLLILIGGAAYRGARILEVAISAGALVLFCWVIFVWALGLVIPVWPGG